MSTLFAAKCGPKHLFTLVASLIQVSYFLFTPSPQSSGNNLILSVTHTSRTSTIKPPTRTTILPPTRTSPHSSATNSGSLGFYLTICALLLGFLFGLATVYSRTGNKPADSINPPPRQPSLPPPVNDPTNDDDDKNETDTGDSDPDNSGNESPGDGDGDGDNSDDDTDEEEADDPPSETRLHDEPDPEDPPPPPPATLDENDDDPKMTSHGPALSLLHFLLGAAAGLFTRLLTMNAANYRHELHRLVRRFAARSLSMDTGSFWPRLSDSPIVGLPCSCHSQPLIIATAQSRTSSQQLRVKVSLPTSLITIIKYTVDTIAELSPIYVSLADTIRPPITWLINAMAQDLVVVEAYISLAIEKMQTIDVDHGSSLRLIGGFTVLLLVVLEVYNAKLPASPAQNTDLYYGDDILFPFADVDLPLEVYNAKLPSSPAYGTNTDLNHGDDILFPFADVDLPFEVYNAKLPASPAYGTNTDSYDGDDILFPFADVDLSLEDFESLTTVDPDSMDHFSTVFPFHDVDLLLVEVELDGPATGHTIVAEPISSVEINDGTILTNGIEPVIELEFQAMEEVFTVSSSLGSINVERVENTEGNKDINETNITVADEPLLSASDDDSSFNAGFCTSAAEDVKSEEIPTSVSNFEEDPDAVLDCLASLFDSPDTDYPSYVEATEEILTSVSNFEEDPDEVLDCLASLFDSLCTDYPLYVEVNKVEETAMPSSAEDPKTEHIIEEDLDTILECLADFFDSPLIPSFAEEGAAGSPIQNDVAVSPSKASGDVCVRAFTSCEAFAEMFGFENEKPLEFLQPLPARLERLLPQYYYLTHTPARWFTLGAPPATPTTPFARWMEEDHQTTPFVPSPFRLPRTPPRTPPTIVIPSPTSSEGTQPADESPAAIRSRRLDRKWAKLMAKRQRNEARNIVPRVQIEETSFSSSLASDTSIRSFFDPHASINRGIVDTKVEAEPTRTTKWKPRSPGDPVPKQRRRWRNKDVLVGAGEDESYGAVAVAVD